VNLYMKNRFEVCTRLMRKLACTRTWMNELKCSKPISVLQKEYAKKIGKRYNLEIVIEVGLSLGRMLQVFNFSSLYMEC